MGRCGFGRLVGCEFVSLDKRVKNVTVDRICKY
jgi:hypothetical protein